MKPILIFLFLTSYLFSNDLFGTEENNIMQTLIGMSYGIALILIIYNSVIYFYTRKKRYILSILIVSSCVLWQLYFPSTVLFIFISIILLVLMSNAFLNATTALILDIKKDKLLIDQSRLASMGKMIEQIAHQWRQPLNDLGLLNQNFYFKQQLGTLEEEDFLKTHDGIDRNIKYMSDTIDDFRNYYKSDKKEETYQLSRAIENILAIVKPSLEYSGIKVILKLNDAVNLHNVKNELQQVLLIILNNAKDAMITSAIEDKKITIEVATDEKNAYINIFDNGGGVPDDIKEKIYDSYFSTKFNSQGTGIGLYMSKSIIEKNMHGFISVKNIDNGACFTVKLPLV
jgi:signal transduction histidine kinase